MTGLYGAKGSFVLLRSKNGVHPTCRKSDLYGEMGIQNFSGIVSQKTRRPQTTGLFYTVRTLLSVWGQGNIFFDVLVSPSNSLG